MKYLFKNTIKKLGLSILALTTGGIALSTPALAYDPILRNFAGGPAGFGSLALNRNDDGSSNQLNLPFSVNFFDAVYDTFWVNNNGNLTFNGPVGTFTPNPFPNLLQPMIAPYWGDVDTRCSTCGEVYLGTTLLDERPAVVATWNQVGFFNLNSSRVNTFQAVLVDRSNDFNSGDFDIQFRYFDPLQWTTGDASQGSGGLGGIPAQAGFDAGNGQDFFTLPGSRTNDVLLLDETSNVSADTPGLWSFAIRSGDTPGSSAENPLLPIVPQNPQDGFNFEFNIELNQRIWIDPIVAVGYDYVVNSGPNFTSVLIPNDFTTDGSYDLLFNGLNFDLLPNSIFSFPAGGVSSFRIEGIDPNLALDPLDGGAFVTGVTFAQAGIVNLNQTPITFDTDNPQPSATPEPSTLLGLLAISSFGVMYRRSRQK